MKLTLRAWQREYLRAVAGHDGDSFLLVACPASGKTLAAAAAAAHVMKARDCDQLVVISPTVVVRDQWASVLGGLGYRMESDFRGGGWPAWQHGVVGTYQQVAARAGQYADAVRSRRTVVVLDEIHHAAEQLAWGEGLAEAFGDAAMVLTLSGTPFRSDRDRIPFVGYDRLGRCIADYSYDYQRAVAEGVCRSIEFRTHDGLITYMDGEQEVTAGFTDVVTSPERRLRAALDPSQPYLRDLLTSAHRDLRLLRRDVPQAAGLVVCDSQQHAALVDQLLASITGELPVLATTDVPQAHEAIRGFADDNVEWLVSVRMVAEGVDIPRIAVIAWATTAKTELMLRQVAGRALRGSAADQPALVHLPADPTLVGHATRLHEVGGGAVSPRERAWKGRTGSRRPTGPQKVETLRRIDPGPFVAWFDRQALAYGGERVAARCGWKDAASGARRLNSWRRGEWGQASLLTILDACHMADVDFYELYSDERFAAHRAFARGDYVPPEGDAVARYRAIAALHSGDEPDAITVNRGRRTAEPQGAVVEISTPALPPSPDDLREQADRAQAARAEFMRLLGTYVQLRHGVDPAYKVASAHGEVAAAIGRMVTAASPDETVAEALDWLREQMRDFARRHPEQVRELANRRRRLSQAPSNQRFVA